MHTMVYTNRVNNIGRRAIPTTWFRIHMDRARSRSINEVYYTCFHYKINYNIAIIGGAQGTVGYDKERGSTINRNQPLSLLFYN